MTHRFTIPELKPTRFEKLRDSLTPSKLNRGQRAVLTAGILMIVIGGVFLMSANSSAYGGLLGNPIAGFTVWAGFSGFLFGCSAGLVLFILSRFGWILAGGAAIVMILIGDSSTNPWITGLMSAGSGYVGFIAGMALMMGFLLKFRPATELPNVFGTSRWANSLDLLSWNLLGSKVIGTTIPYIEGTGVQLGYDEASGRAITYHGDMHGLTIAPTRSGKGACAIVPNLLRSKASILVVDPKGENARRSVHARSGKNKQVFVVDACAISTQADKYGPGIGKEHLACYNPLDGLDPNDPDLATDAMLLADALVIDNARDSHWSNEAKALIYGIILYVVTDPREAGQRHLGRVRDILCLPPMMKQDGKTDSPDLTGTMDEIIIRMMMSEYPVVRSSANRYMQKENKERAGVLSTAQANTHFLDSPKIRESLSRSDFSFADLKSDTRTTVYLVLPLDRLPSFNRWLRLMVTSALTQLMRLPAKPHAEPVRIILDEFPALGSLQAVESAYGTMAGLGVQLWVICQDIGQLTRHYGDKAWQTFVSNSGFIQYFGSRDKETADYLSHLTGMAQLKKRSISIGKNENWGSSKGQNSSSSKGGGNSETITIDDVQRPLAFPDELMTLHRDRQIIFVENRYPILAKKYWWFKHQPEKR